MNKKMKAGIVVLAVIGGIAGLAWYNASIAERIFRQGFAPPGDECPTTGIEVSLVDFDRGLFSSRAVTPIDLSGMGINIPGLALEHLIDHFPVLRVSTKLLLDGRTIDSLEPIQTRLYRNGSFNTSWNPTDLDRLPIVEDTATLSLKNASLMLNASPRGLKYNFELGELNVDTRSHGRLSMVGAGMKEDRLGPGVLCSARMTGRTVFKADRLGADTGFAGFVRLEDLHLIVDTATRGEDLDVESTIAVKSVEADSLPKSLAKLADIDLEFKVRKIPRPAYLKFSRTLAALNRTMAGTMLDDREKSIVFNDVIQHGLTVFIEEVARNSPAINLEKLKFALAPGTAGYTLRAEGQMKIDSVAAHGRPLQNRPVLELQIKIGKKMLGNVSAGLPVNWLAQSIGPLDLDKPAAGNAGSIPAPADSDAFRRAFVDQMKRHGWLHDEGDDYLLWLKAADGDWLLNGKPLFKPPPSDEPFVEYIDDEAEGDDR